MRPIQRTLYERIVAMYMLLDRHRTWPEQLCATDLDSLSSADDLAVLEYHRNHEVSLVDYKWARAGLDASLNSSAIAIQRTWARKAQVPFYVAQYYEHDWSFRWMKMETYGLNQWVNGTETDWVRLQMGLRHMALDPNWAPAPIHNRPATFEQIADAVIRDGGDDVTVARFLTKLQMEFR